MTQILHRPIVPDVRIVAAPPDWDGKLAGRVEGGTRKLVQARYEAMLDRWADAFGIRRGELRPEADLEDWTENAARLLAAIDTGLPTHVLQRGENGGAIAVEASFNGEAFSPEAPTAFIGSTLRWEPLYPSFHRDQNPVLADLRWPVGGGYSHGGDYHRSLTLVAALNRPAFVASGNADGPDGYAAATRKVLSAGAREVMAKIVFQGKYQAPTVLPLKGADPSDREIFQAYYEAFDANLMDCDERKDAFLVQARIPMTREYRIVVVGGRPVAGAGVIPWMSPIFHDPEEGDFDPMVETHVGDGKPSPERATVDRYRRKADEVCAAVAREALESGSRNRFENCTMDFAVDADRDEVVLIETNPLDNFGLYAMDFAPVMAAIVDAITPEPARETAP